MSCVSTLKRAVCAAVVGVFALACSKSSPPGTATGENTGTGEKPSAADAGVTVAPVAAKAADAAVAVERPWNVVLLTVDSLRADMPWAGYDRPIAPRLSALQAKSITYSHAYSTSSFTSKSIPGLLTGRYPSELARTGYFFTKYLVPAEFVCTGLDAQGIPCVGGHAHAYFGKGQSGFESGFRNWRIVPGISFDYQTDPYVTSDKLTPLAIEMLGDVASGAGARENKPFFAWFHYMDPHDEYKSHAESPHFGKRPRDLYDEEVFFADLWIGKLLDWIDAQPWAARTAIIVTADHGEAFGEHGITRHAHEVWEELVHVPMFVHVPGLAPRVIDATRGAADIAPTVLDLVGAESVASLHGRSLVPELRGVPSPARDVIVDLPEDEYNERRRALIHERTKLIAFGNDVRFALYDLEADPKESEDLIRKRPDLADDMRRRYKEASKAIVESPPRGGVPTHDR